MISKDISCLWSIIHDWLVVRFCLQRETLSLACLRFPLDAILSTVVGRCELDISRCRVLKWVCVSCQAGMLCSSLPRVFCLVSLLVSSGCISFFKLRWTLLVFSFFFVTLPLKRLADHKNQFLCNFISDHWLVVQILCKFACLRLRTHEVFLVFEVFSNRASALACVILTRFQNESHR